MWILMLPRNSFVVLWKFSNDLGIIQNIVCLCPADIMEKVQKGAEPRRVRVAEGTDLISNRECVH